MPRKAPACAYIERDGAARAEGGGGARGSEGEGGGGGSPLSLWRNLLSTRMMRYICPIVANPAQHTDTCTLGGELSAKDRVAQNSSRSRSCSPPDERRLVSSRKTDRACSSGRCLVSSPSFSSLGSVFKTNPSAYCHLPLSSRFHPLPSFPRLLSLSSSR